MKEVWIVWGSSGEYDDYSDWVVAVYARQAEAEKHRMAAVLWINDNALRLKDLSLDEWSAIKNPYDPNGGIQSFRSDVHYQVGAPTMVLKKFAPVA